MDIEQDMGSVLAISPLNVEDLTHSTANMNSANKSTDAGHKFLFNEVGSVEPTEPARCGIVVIVTRSAIFAVIVNLSELSYSPARICEYCYCICGL